jgi:hypothetical protein
LSLSDLALKADQLYVEREDRRRRSIGTESMSVHWLILYIANAIDDIPVNRCSALKRAEDAVIASHALVAAIKGTALD